MTYDEAVTYYRALLERPGAISPIDFAEPFGDFAEPLDDEAVRWAAWTELVAAAARTAESTDLVALVVGVRDKQGFGAAMREAWNADPADDPDAWANLNGFAARLTAAGVDFILYALWSIGAALETFGDPGPQLSAAVQWFRHSGPQLVSATLHGRTFGPGPGRLHERAEQAGLTEGGFSVPRWMYWRSRLQGLADAGDPVAAEGLRYMRRHDREIASH